MDKEIKRDYLGNEVSVGDEVVYTYLGYEVSVGDEVVYTHLGNFLRGNIIKLMPKTVLIQYNHSTEPVQLLEWSLESIRFYDQIIKI